MHVQSDTVMLPAADVVEGGHVLHKALPMVSLYVPATHGAQTPPFGPENPPLHTHSDLSTLSTSESEFAGHSVHVALPIVSL